MAMVPSVYLKTPRDWFANNIELFIAFFLRHDAARADGNEVILQLNYSATTAIRSRPPPPNALTQPIFSDKIWSIGNDAASR